MNGFGCSPNNRDIVISVWRSETAYSRFAKALKKKLKADMNHFNWDGKEKGEPHPLFEKWLINGKL